LNQGSYDDHRFTVRAHMERGCRPILKVQFFPGTSNKDKMVFAVALVTPGDDIFIINVLTPEMWATFTLKMIGRKGFSMTDTPAYLSKAPVGIVQGAVWIPRSIIPQPTISPTY